MRLLFHLFIICALPVFSLAQDGPNVVRWEFSVAQKEKDLWTLKATATMDKGYHIWALEAGGDGSLIPTAISVDEPDEFSWEGDWKTLRKPREHTYEFIEGAVYFFEGTASFMRDFRVGEDVTTLNGSVEYQTCNERMCYPPASEDFSVELR